MPIKTFTLTLAWTKLISPHVRHFAFSCDDSTVFDFIPGQFITVHFTVGEKQLRRSYSIATVPGESEWIEFAAGYVEDGPGTNLLLSLREGDHITASGPFGRLVLQDENPKRYVFVATSTGVTPYRSMLKQLANYLQNTEHSAVLLLGAQTREELIYSEEFIHFAEQHPNFQFLACYSRESLTADEQQAYEHLGYVQTAFEQIALRPDRDVVYLCGNPNMVDECFNILKEQEFAVQQIKREKYLSK